MVSMKTVYQTGYEEHILYERSLQKVRKNCKALSVSIPATLAKKFNFVPKVKVYVKILSVQGEQVIVITPKR